jgi:predicted ester cyclase
MYYFIEYKNTLPSQCNEKQAILQLGRMRKKESHMDAEKNKAVLGRVITEVFNQGNYQVLPDLFNPDFIEHQFGLHPTIAGIQSDVEYLRRSFPDLKLTIEDMATTEDKVWVRMTARGTNTGGIMGPPNGKTFEIAVFDLCRFRDGKIVEHWGSPDRFAMLAQLGLLPRG